MEYRIEKLLTGLEIQRSQVVTEICSLNENLPNYTMKTMELNNQITSIDNKINDLIYALKDIKLIELQNELTIKTSK